MKIGVSAASRSFQKNYGDFCGNIFARVQQSIVMGPSGFLPRLHGFHRFLPHLWELFLFGLEASPANRVVLDPVGSSPLRGWHF